ncbi:hypothetical protein EDD29_0477 [Actinocorallia herbida]|uniref:MYXO-CTERM domain-containing protein n=1 Tax=Actinocorallia herbida TaxID=58109 RepID=A0A3N1CNT6_9ACTN|nr:hypothetical protein [Actinocorallia herbida]ROO82989.1 hypothetical protein EDD29_0477 [Actinocorallia herbida]
MSAEPSPGEIVAAALRRSPLYLDPAYETALPEADRAKVLAAVEKETVPFWIIMVPFVKGGTWSEPDEMITIVHDRLKRDGVYLVPTASGSLTAKRFGGTRQEGTDAIYGAALVRYLDEYDEAPLADRLLKAMDAITAGNAEAEYEKATAYLHETPNPVARLTKDEWGDTSPVRVTALGLGAAAVAGLAVWRWRRTRGPAPREAHPLVLSRATLEAARHADENGLRKQAAAAVVALGELVEGTEVPSDDPRGQELISLALDAYQAAGKVLDAAKGVPDLAGVLVLVDIGSDAIAAVRARRKGGREIPPSPLCFYNPLHGDATAQVTWRRIGSRDSIRVRACQACAKAVRDHRSPESLLDTSGDRPLPYYAADSLWSRTGYGQFGDTGSADGSGDGLVARVLRGDHRT